MTAQEVYQLYHHYCLLAKNGVPPRAIKNFGNFEKSKDKIYFERVADLANNSPELFNVRAFIRCLAEQYKGFFPPKILIAPSAIKIYRIYLKQLNDEADPEAIYKQVISSCRFIVDFCKANSIRSFSDYLEHNAAMIPSLIAHVYSGKVSYSFLGCIDFFPHIAAAYPNDAMEMIHDFDYKLARSKVVFVPKCKAIADNLNALIDSLIAKED